MRFLRKNCANVKFFLSLPKFNSMKKFLSILVICIIACTSSAYAQLVINNNNNENVTGSTFTTETDLETEIVLKIKNTSAEQISDLRVALKQNGNIVTSASSSDVTYNFCMGFTCYQPFAQTSAFSLAADAEKELHLTITGYTPATYTVVASNGSVSAECYVNVINDPTKVDINEVAFNVYPNPTRNSFTIENNFGKNQYVEIYNVLGQLVTEVKSTESKVVVDCSSWKNGYYICRSYKNNKIDKSIKVVVSH